MRTYHLAIDIGASSGRHMLMHVDEDGMLHMEEVHRFKNGMKRIDRKKLLDPIDGGHEPMESQLCWDHEYLFHEILEGLKRCKELNKCPTTVGIDTWGVDFVLLDENKKVIGNTVAYRDQRTEGMMALVEAAIPTMELYERTGIYPASFNTIYQLLAVKRNHPEELAKAKYLLFTPDYFFFLLTGETMNEYTIASTSGLVEVASRQWDQGLLKRLGLPKSLFGQLNPPGVAMRRTSAVITAAIGYELDVVLTTSHDTASAVLAVPAEEEDYIFLSSGTWSLLGVETSDYNCSVEGFKAGFTNEGGYGGKYRYLRNIMGLWMIQEVQKELQREQGILYSFAELCKLAKSCSTNAIAYVEVNDTSFMAPESMITAIRMFCHNTGQRVPETPAELANVIYHSLAKCYKEAVEGVERITKKTYSRIHIVGGGSNARYLNELTEEYTGKKVYSGPSEATAIGNVLGQMLASGEIEQVEVGRKLVRDFIKSTNSELV